MTNKRLKVIISLMSVALLGLIIIQFFWINDAMEEYEKRFDFEINEVMNAVSNNLEQREVVSITKNFFFADGKNIADSKQIQFDSLKVFGFKRPYDIKQRSLNPNFFSEQQYDINVDVDDKNTLFDFKYNSKDENNQIQSNDIKIELKHYTAQIDSLIDKNDEYSKNSHKVRERSQMLTIVLNELYSKERPLTNRIDAVLLDSLVKKELRQRGINAKYCYAVVDHKSDSFLLTKFPKHRHHNFSKKKLSCKLNDSPYRVGLFRQDINGSPSELILDFPKQERFILKKIWLTLSSSFLLLLIVVVAFAYSIHTIISQKKLSEMKDDFIDNMTHELKTPIATVSLACEALSDKEMQGNPQILSRYLGIISDENVRLGSQVEKVLQIARMERGDMRLSLEKTDLHEIIRELTHNYQLIINKREGKLILNLDAQNPYLISDKVHLENIINNILDNANKYTIDKAPYIIVSTQNCLDGIIVRITDNGIGISREVQKHIFDKFYREPTGNLHDVKGFGLGLAYVKKMVKALSGRICVYSASKKGSTFEIFFPYE